MQLLLKIPDQVKQSFYILCHIFLNFFYKSIYSESCLFVSFSYFQEFYPGNNNNKNTYLPTLFFLAMLIETDNLFFLPKDLETFVLIEK